MEKAHVHLSLLCTASTSTKSDKNVSIIPFHYSSRKQRLSQGVENPSKYEWCPCGTVSRTVLILAQVIFRERNVIRTRNRNIEQDRIGQNIRSLRFKTHASCLIRISRSSGRDSLVRTWHEPCTATAILPGIWHEKHRILSLHAPVRARTLENNNFHVSRVDCIDRWRCSSLPVFNVTDAGRFGPSNGPTLPQYRWVCTCCLVRWSVRMQRRVSAHCEHSYVLWDSPVSVLKKKRRQIRDTALISFLYSHIQRGWITEI